MRGLHNLMERRAAFRSPGPPLRLRRPHQQLRAHKPFRAAHQGYKHQHRREVDRETLEEFVKACERLNRELDRKLCWWEREFYEMPRGLFDTAPGRGKVCIRDYSHTYSSTTTSPIAIRYYGYGISSTY